jgi:uncharacterized membrane protein
MKDKSFWFQIGLSALLSVVFGSSIIFVLSQFRERLPEGLYDVAIYTIYIFFVVVLFVLVILLIRFAFGDWFTKLRRWQEHHSYRKNRLKVAGNWCDKWIDLSQILLNASSNDWRVSDEEQNKYSNLRNWFRLNRSKFLPIWGWFKRERERAAHEYAGRASLMYKVFYESHDDPFSYFYSPSTLEEFDDILEYHENDMPLVLLRLREQLEELIEWIKFK